MAKIVHAQTVLYEDEIEALKKKTGEPNTKDAIAKAIHVYLDADNKYNTEGEHWLKNLNNLTKKRLEQGK